MSALCHKQTFYGPRIIANRSTLAKMRTGDSIGSMRLGALHRHRGLPVALALMGMMFYVVLVPWHTLSQTILQFSQASAVTGPHAMGGEASKTSKPEKPRTKCPICNGFAALQMAVSAPACCQILRVAEKDTAPAPQDDSVAAAGARTPQNRGPPFLT
jgi:hypothetical protein